MGQVFVSYSRHDIEIADALVSRLADAGLEVWIDRQDIRAGRHWRTEIVTAIDECAALILLLSPHSIASDNVLKEVTLAEGSNRRIFPVFIQDTELLPDMRYLLAGVQFIDFTGDNMNTAYEQLESGLLENQRLVEELEAKKQADTGTRETEIVIQGVNLEKFDQSQQEKLLAFLAEMTDSDVTDMSIASMQAGSVHVFIQMPTETAFSLKALALNDDPRFKKMRITAIGVAGTGIVTLSTPFWFSLLGCLTAPTVAITSVVAVTTLVVVAITLGPKIFGGDTTNNAVNTATTTYIPTETEAAQGDVASAATDTSVPSTSTAAEVLEATETETPVAVVDETARVTANATTRCRSTFNLGGDAVSFINEGDTTEVLGISEDGHWFYISPPGTGQRCWVSDATVTFRGSAAGLQIWYATATPTPTLTPKPTASPTAGVPGSIAGMVWEDTDHDGVFLYYDYPFYGVTVYLKVADCITVLNTTVTDSDGEFSFSNVPPGTYCVEVDHTTLPLYSTGSWDPDAPDFPINVSPTINVKVGAGATITIDFRYIE